MYDDPKVKIKALEKRNRRLYNDLYRLQKQNELLKSPEAFVDFMSRQIANEINQEIIKEMWRMHSGSSVYHQTRRGK